VVAVQFDLGFQGLGLLVGMSVAFGVIAQAVFWSSATHWLWLVGAAAYFVGGLFFSEVVFGSATEDELQPIIDGLAFDEALLCGLIIGVPAVLVTWYVTRRSRLHRPASSGRSGVEG
jgi:hypothetical protein